MFSTGRRLHDLLEQYAGKAGRFIENRQPLSPVRGRTGLLGHDQLNLRRGAEAGAVLPIWGGLRQFGGRAGSATRCHRRVSGCP
jgi:hypothetical protein